MTNPVDLEWTFSLLSLGLGGGRRDWEGLRGDTKRLGKKGVRG